DQASALLVERFLGATLHSVIVRDAAAADAVRAWHTETNPGPLLLLPLDASPAAGHDSRGSLSQIVDAAPAARDWVRALLGGVQTLQEGGAFVDARGAVWLPGQGGGPGPLRRRAELYALRAELTASEVARQQASAAADALRAAVQLSEQRLDDATEAMSAARQEMRHAADHHAELERRAHRAER